MNLPGLNEKDIPHLGERAKKNASFFRNPEKRCVLLRGRLFKQEPVSYLMMAVALSAVIHGVPGRFADAVGHTGAKDTHGIPESAKENGMSDVPNPFKTKWKHKVFSFI